MAKAVVVARGLVDLGPRTAGAVVASTARTAARQLRDRRAERDAARSVPRPPGPLVGAEPLDDGAGARLVFASAELEVRYLAADLVRVSWGPDDPPVGWALAGTAGSLAGLLVAPLSSFSPYYMDLNLVYGFTAAVLGGLVSPVGALVGGLVTGLCIAFVGGYVGPDLQPLAALALLLVVLMARPQGLFGRPEARRV